jgi:hypothetical protein
MTVYVDDAFTHNDSWGKWNGGGHLMADTDAELHEFAAKLGLKRSWAQIRPHRPEFNHYDLVRSKRDKALALGAQPEDAAGFVSRLEVIRAAQGQHVPLEPTIPEEGDHD